MRQRILLQRRLHGRARGAHLHEVRRAFGIPDRGADRKPDCGADRQPKRGTDCKPIRQPERGADCKPIHQPDDVKSDNRSHDHRANEDPHVYPLDHSYTQPVIQSHVGAHSVSNDPKPNWQPHRSTEQRTHGYPNVAADYDPFFGSLGCTLGGSIGGTKHCLSNQESDRNSHICANHQPDCIPDPAPLRRRLPRLHKRRRRWDLCEGPSAYLAMHMRQRILLQRRLHGRARGAHLHEVRRAFGIPDRGADRKPVVQSNDYPDIQPVERALVGAHSLPDRSPNWQPDSCSNLGPHVDPHQPHGHSQPQPHHCCA